MLTLCNVISGVSPLVFIHSDVCSSCFYPLQCYTPLHLSEDPLITTQPIYIKKSLNTFLVCFMETSHPIISLILSLHYIHTMTNIPKDQGQLVTNNMQTLFPVQLCYRLISAKLELVHSLTEISRIATYYRIFQQMFKQKS